MSNSQMRLGRRIIKDRKRESREASCEELAVVVIRVNLRLIWDHLAGIKYSHDNVQIR